MRKFTSLLLLLMFATVIFGQVVDSDTIYIKEKVSKLVKSPFGLQLSLGVTKFIYDDETIEYIGNHWSGDFKLSFYYNNLFFAADFRPMTVNIKKPLYFNEKELNELADLNVIKTDLMLGYCFNIFKTVSIEPYVGYLSTNFPVINQDVLNETYQIKSAKGITGGFTLNKYIHLKHYDYFVFFFNNNYNLSNYSKTNANLGNHFYSFSFGIAYKGWFPEKVYK